MKPQEINFERIAVQAIFPGEEIHLNGQKSIVPEGEQLYLVVGDSDKIGNIQYVINDEQLNKYEDTGSVIPDGELFWLVMRLKKL